MKIVRSIFLLMLIIVPALSLNADEGWRLRKEKNGIQVYTKERPESHLYMYKVRTRIVMKPQKVYEQVVDFRENLKYMELLDSIAYLDHRQDERYMNYMRFDLPWPVKNREMVMDMKVQIGTERIRLVSNNKTMSRSSGDDMIPIEDFYEEWVIEWDESEKITHITVQGWVNPGGAIPSWVVNLFSVRTPFRFISGILRELKKEK